jgi:hypothetical protein
MENLITQAAISIFAALGTFGSTYTFQYFKDNKDNRKQEKELKQALNLEFIKINSILDKLKSDLEERNYFQLKNTYQASDSNSRLKRLIENIILINNDSLRSEIRDAVDLVFTLFDEINAIEGLYLDEKIKDQKNLLELRKEFRNYQILILQKGFVVKSTTPLEIIYSQQDPNTELSVDKRLEIDAIIEVINSLVQDLRTSEDRLKQIELENTRRRPLLNSRILDIQSKLRELNSKLLR